MTMNATSLDFSSLDCLPEPTLAERFPLLDSRRWTHPRDYAGESPAGYFSLTGQHRDSDALDRCNFNAFRELLAGWENDNGAPDDDDPHSPGSWYFVLRASHWAVGWVETLMLRPDAPEGLLALAEETLRGLEGYPVIDEDAFSELEWTEHANGQCGDGCPHCESLRELRTWEIRWAFSGTPGHRLMVRAATQEYAVLLASRAFAEDSGALLEDIAVEIPADGCLEDYLPGLEDEEEDRVRELLDAFERHEEGAYRHPEE